MARQPTLTLVTHLRIPVASMGQWTACLPRWYQHWYSKTSAGSFNRNIVGYTWGSSGGADLAEEYLIEDESINAGDIVSLMDKKLYIEKSIASSSYPMLGIISTKPGLRLKDWEYDPQNNRAVALSGRVPVKISLENGDIKTGDRLTVSKTKPGHAMRQTEPGQSVGIAMEEFLISKSEFLNNDQNIQTDKILVFLNLSYWSPDINTLLTQTANQDNLASASSQATYVNTLFKIIVNQFSSLYDVVFENGLVKVVKIVAEI